jgi:bacteriorhodopsin
MATNVILTGKISLGIQFLVGGVDIYALALPRPREVLLRDLLKVEVGVQMVEFIFYIWMVRQWKSIQKSLKRILQFRYIDWMITTPTMLITLMAFLGGSPQQSLLSFIQEHLNFIIYVLILNFFMLWIGLYGEWGHIPQTQSVLFGFIPFVLYYGMIYNRFIVQQNLPSLKLQLFYYFFIIWSLYGVMGLFPPISKNIGYNILDLFSKNIVGVILSVVLIRQPAN